MERCGSLKRVCDFSGMQAKRRRCWLWTLFQVGVTWDADKGSDKAHVPFFSDRPDYCAAIDSLDSFDLKIDQDGRKG